MEQTQVFLLYVDHEGGRAPRLEGVYKTNEGAQEQGMKRARLTMSDEAGNLIGQDLARGIIAEIGDTCRYIETVPLRD